MTLRHNEVTDLIREGLLFFMGAEASATQFNSSILVLKFTAYIRNFICPQRQQSKGIGQVTLVAKRPDTATQSNAFENVV